MERVSDPCPCLDLVSASSVYRFPEAHLGGLEMFHAVVLGLGEMSKDDIVRGERQILGRWGYVVERKAIRPACAQTGQQWTARLPSNP